MSDHSRLKPLIIFILPFLAGALSLCIGRYWVPLDDVLEAIYSYLFTPERTTSEIVVMKVRMPRILLAALVGCGLALAGAAFQSTLSNPLASPDIIGVSSASAFGAVLGLLLGLSPLAIQFMAVAVGLIAIAGVFLLCRVVRTDSILTIVLAGIIIAGVFNALIALAKYVADPLTQLPDIVYWLMGGLSGTNYKTIYSVLPLMLVSIALLYLLRWRLNIISQNDEEIRAMGHDPRKLRWVFMIAATFLVASSVSVCGQIGWVGLVIPHMARLIVGSDNNKVVPVSMALGAAFLIVCDTICRSLIEAEIPLSIVTALIGAPIFIVLFIRRFRRWMVS